MARKRYTNADLDWLPSFAKLVGPIPPDDFQSNGATDAPDILLGADTRPADHFHDFAYSEECRALGRRDEAARYKADQFYKINLATCGFAWLLAPFRFVYYFRLRLWGHFAFTYDPGCEPRRTVRFWLRLLFGRYVTW